MEQLIRALPKAEQHVHLVGSTRPETLLWLAEEAGIKKPFETAEEACRFFQYRDFQHFISIYSTVMNCITHEGQFERITYELLENNARCNVHYVEVSFSAPDHTRKGLNYGLMLEAINRGVDRARHDFGVECTIRIDLVRNYGPEAGMETLGLIENNRENVVAIDIGGSEERFPPEPFLSVYRKAKEIGLHLVAHAGEAAGPESVWSAVRDLGVEHVGHGLAACADPKLLDYLRVKGVTVEMCPVSNVRTGVVSSFEKHPIRTFLERGINVTVSTDDPSMFDTDMNGEYLQLHRKLNFTVPELFKLSLNAVDSSFLPHKKKIRMHKAFVNEYQRLLDT